MANELQAVSASGTTLYVVLLNGNGEAYNGSSFETPAAANWTTYDIAMSEASTTGIYRGTMPAVAAGVYSWLVYKQAGASPATTDLLVGSGQIQWNGTAQLGLSNVVLGPTQPGVTFGQVKITANVGNQGALHITNSASLNGYGIYARGDNAGTWNHGVYGVGLKNEGGQYGNINQGSVSDVEGVDSVGIRTAIGLAAADLDTQLGALPTAEETAGAVWNEEMDDHLDPTTTGGHLNVAEMAGLVGGLIESVGYDRFKVSALENMGNHVVEGGFTFDEVLRIVAAALAGVTSGGGTPTLEFLGLDGKTTRIAATVDGNGNRLQVAVDGD